MSEGLADGDDLHEDLTEEVRTPKRSRRRAKTPEPELSEELDQTLVILRAWLRDSEEDDGDDSDAESEDAFDGSPSREVGSDSGSGM
ncbi:hypothetical protein P3342_004600 [Pyrenophora teres f. teres]|nr:hypothetical protein P3342_004600 [Pyrenophora teres f. teres]